jgi:hypothetical protein
MPYSILKRWGKIRHYLTLIMASCILISIPIIIFVKDSYDSSEHEKYQRTKLAKDITAIKSGQQDGIYFYDTNNTDSQLSELRHLRNLKYIHLDMTDVTDEGMAYLKDIPDLREIKITGGRLVLGDSGIKQVAECAQLETFSMQHRGIFLTSDAIRALKKLPKLRVLNLYFDTVDHKSPINDKLIADLKGFPSLEILYIYGPWYTEQNDRELKENLSTIKVNPSESAKQDK